MTFSSLLALILKYKIEMSLAPLGQGFTHGQDIHYDVVLS